MTQITREEALHAFRTLGQLLQEVYDVDQNRLLAEVGISIPSHVFRSDLTPFQAVVTYLDQEGVAEKKIAKLLDRNRTFVRKSIKDAELQKTGTLLPVNIFAANLSILEATAHYLSQQGKSNAEIAEEIGRSQSAVWMLLNRAEEKIGGESE